MFVLIELKIVWIPFELQIGFSFNFIQILFKWKNRLF